MAFIHFYLLQLLLFAFFDSVLELKNKWEWAITIPNSHVANIIANIALDFFKSRNPVNTDERLVDANNEQINFVKQ